MPYSSMYVFKLGSISKKQIQTFFYPQINSEKKRSMSYACNEKILIDNNQWFLSQNFKYYEKIKIVLKH